MKIQIEEANLRSVLSALEYWNVRDEFSTQTSKAITSIREALAQSRSDEEQPAQPKGCQCPACKIAPHASDCPVHNEPAWPNGPCDCGALAEQPAQQYSATSDHRLMENAQGEQERIKLVQTGIGIGNPAPSGEQQELASASVEPVAWYHAEEYKTHFTSIPSQDMIENGYWKPIYATPPASKPWVPLTDEEIEKIWQETKPYFDKHDFARAIEAAHGIKENT